MQLFKSSNILFAAAIIIAALSLNSCMKSDDTQLPSPDSAIGTGLCEKTWVLDSIGENPATAEQFQSYYFSSLGDGILTSYDKDKAARVTTKFSWASYYGYLLTIKFDGQDYTANVYYGIQKNGTLRFAGTDDNGVATYYQFKAQD